MNIFNDFAVRIRAAAEGVLAAGGDPVGTDDVESLFRRIVVEPPRDSGHGDLSTNAALILAKPLSHNPRKLAEAIAVVLRDDPDVAAVEIAGPGFINLRLKPSAWHAVLAALIAAGDAYGRSTLGGGERINVEYVSANPTGPMHVGHTRGAVFGDALASLLAFAGYDVTREYYINDAGAQVDVLARSVYLRYREALGEDIGAIPDGLYPGDYLKPVGAALAAKYGATLRDMSEAEWLPIVRGEAVEAMMALIRNDLALLGVAHEVFSSERALYEPDASGRTKIDEAIAFLEEQKLVYRGTLPPPKGQADDDWEPQELLLFRTTSFGDDADRPILKSDGTPTYITPDVAYHWELYRRGFANMIIVLGADHSGYIKRLKAAVTAVSGGKATIDVKICQLVRLLRGGEPVKMSKRAGEFITLRDVVEEVGRDPIRFMMLFRKNDAPLDFDFDKVTEQSKDNPVFYVQYAHARTASVFRQALAEMGSADRPGESAPLDRLNDEGELALIRRLAEFPRIIEAAAEAHEPHRIAFYLHDLASAFHGHWNRGKELPQLRFINPADTETTAARLALVHALQLVLSSGLAILGVSAPQEMR